MERLSEKLAWAIEDCVDSWSEVQETAIMGAIKRLAYYEELEEQGRLVVLPCKVGQTVWFIRPLDAKKEIAETIVEKVVKKDRGLFVKLACNAMYETSCSSIGKTVFLTREEAEAALRGGKEDG